MCVCGVCVCGVCVCGVCVCGVCVCVWCVVCVCVWCLCVCLCVPRSLRRRSAAARLLKLGGFETHREHGSLSIVSVVFCQVEVSAMG